MPLNLMTLLLELQKKEETNYHEKDIYSNFCSAIIYCL